MFLEPELSFDFDLCLIIENTNPLLFSVEMSIYNIAVCICNLHLADTVLLSSVFSRAEKIFSGAVWPNLLWGTEEKDRGM